MKAITIRISVPFREAGEGELLHFLSMPPFRLRYGGDRGFFLLKTFAVKCAAK
jgi:hypothetical protein